MTGLARWRPALALAVLVIAVDQATKALMMGLLLTPPHMVELLPVLNLTPVWNHGVSFGMFAGYQRWSAYALSVLSVVVVAVLAVWLQRTERLVPALGIGAVMGGALGNVIDRLRFGAVFDYLQAHVAALAFPWVFNVADAGISLGVAALLLDGLRRQPTGGSLPASARGSTGQPSSGDIP